MASGWSLRRGALGGAAGFATSITDLPVIGVPFEVGAFRGVDALSRPSRSQRRAGGDGGHRQREERRSSRDPHPEALSVRVGIGYDSHRFVAGRR